MLAEIEAQPDFKSILNKSQKTSYKHDLQRYDKIYRSIAEEMIRASRLGENVNVQKLIKESGLTRGKVTNIITRLKANGITRLDEIPDYLVTRNAFLAHPKIVELNSMVNKQHIKSQITNSLYKICRTLILPPEKVISDTRTSQICFNEYITRLGKPPSQELVGGLKTALRLNGIQVNTNVITFDKGKNDYSNVQLTDAELSIMLDNIERKHGVEFKNIVALHHEIFPRPSALFTNNYSPIVKTTNVDGKQYDYLEVSIYESKQKKRYTKLILNPKVIEIMRERNGKIIAFEKLKELTDKYEKILRDAYIELGKYLPDVLYRLGEREWFFRNRPAHTLRHSGAHMWMRRTGFNAGLVATMGWDSPSTLTKFYAGLTPSTLMMQGVCFHCRPPPTLTGDMIFCSPTHALAYMWNHKGDT